MIESLYKSVELLHIFFLFMSIQLLKKIKINKRESSKLNKLHNITSDIKIYENELDTLIKCSKTF